MIGLKDAMEFRKKHCAFCPTCGDVLDERGYCTHQGHGGFAIEMSEHAPPRIVFVPALQVVDGDFESLKNFYKKTIEKDDSAT